MKNKLTEIRQSKEREVQGLSLPDPEPRACTHAFSRALRAPGLSVIAEIKRRSPSVGDIADILQPAELAGQYIEGGAAAISVLTDSDYFGGSISDLADVAAAYPDTPVLRKDFIIDPIQLKEAVCAGADAVLLIVALLGHRTKELLNCCHTLGLEALVEVHTREELDIALQAGAAIIGVNSRSLDTFEVDLTLPEQLIGSIPSAVITVAESGICSAADALRMRDAGFDAVLVGEALVRAASPQNLVRKMRGLINA